MIPSLAKFAEQLRRLPRVVAQQVTAKAAPAITALAVESFDGSETPYGVPWASGADGHKVTLRKTGALERQIRYVAIGTKLRVALGVDYAKYQVGKRPVFPRAGALLPPAYVEVLQRIAVDAVRDELR